MTDQLPATMRAVQADSFGGPSVLRVREVPLRAPRASRAVVRMVATTVNPLDLEIRRGELRALKRPPFGTGLDVCGHVVRAGARWSGPPVGAPVWGALGGLPVKRLMAAAEYVEVGSGWVVDAPTRIPLAEAAALPVAALTAYLGLRALRVRRGSRVLIRGASGGVGTVAIQIAREWGVHVVALCSPRNSGLCLSLGARETLDYHSLEWDDLSPVDAALDLVGGDDLVSVARVVRNDGRVAAVVPDRPRAILTSVLSGKTVIKPVFALPSRPRLTELVRLIDRGLLAPVTARRFPLARVADAHYSLEADSAPGKRIIDIDPSHGWA